MVSSKKKKEKISSTKLIRSFVIVVVIAVMMGLFAKLIMNSLNKKMGIEVTDINTTTDSSIVEETYEPVAMPEFEPNMGVDITSSVWVPEWKSTVCSLFVSQDSDPAFDSLPQAPEISLQRTELQLLVELWADYAGFEQIEIERIWVFTSNDSCFVDFPRTANWQGIAKTIKGRFVTYSILIPFISGEIVEGMEEGISIIDIYTSI